MIKGMVLTEKQQRVLEFIQSRLRDTNRAPTYREIARAMGVDIRSAYQHVVALERKNVVVRTGAGAMRKHIDLTPEFRPARDLPVLGRVPAGVPLAAEEEVDLYFEIDRLRARGLFAVVVQGDSMIDRGLLEGDLAVVRSGSQVHDGQIVVAAVGDEYTIKTLKTVNGVRHLCPENSSGPYSALPIDREDARILGPVVFVIRDLASAGISCPGRDLRPKRRQDV